jgi:hypothetical protein
MSWKLKRPFTAIIAGPSSSGKTEFALSLIEEQTSVIDHQGGNDNEGAFTKIIWCHGVDQSKVFDRLRRLVPAAKLQIVEGFPSAEIRNGKLLRGSKPKLLILDDLLQEVEKDANFFDLFIKLSHHTNTSVIFITQVSLATLEDCIIVDVFFFQNLYNPTCRSNSTILRNTTYFVISVTTQQFAVVRYYCEWC